MHKTSSTRQPFRLVAVFLGITLLIWLIVRTGTGTVIAHARAIGWGMALILALGGISHLVRTWAWRLTFRSDIRGISLGRTFALRLISEAIGNFGLAGQVVGDTMRVSLLGPAVPIADRISSVALDRGLYMMTAAVVSVIGVLASVLMLPLPGAWRLAALVFAATLVMLLLLTVVSFGRGWRFLSRAAYSGQRLPWAKQWLANKISVIESAEENLLTFHSLAPRSFWAAIALYIGSQALAIAEVYLLLRFMGARITFVGSLVIEAFTKLISVIGALNPGNIGTFEGGNLLLARLLGFTTAAGLTLALCRRARVLFWAAVGALCLIVLSRGKEQSRHEPAEVTPSGDAPESQAGGEMCAKGQPHRDGRAVIIVVESAAEGAFIPGLARVGALPVLLRVILSAEQTLQPSRIVVSVPPSIAGLLAGKLRRTGRLPHSVEWRERPSGTAFSSVLSDVASTADGIVLLSGTTIYKPALLQTLREPKAPSDAMIYVSGREAVGIYSLTQAAALQFAKEGRFHSFADLHDGIKANCDATIVQTPGAEWQHVFTPPDGIAAEQKLDTWMYKPTDGRFACFNRRISIPISRQLIKTPITPNAVTFMILAVSVAAGVFFARGGYWNMLAGALLSVWASILDGCDGEVARFKLQSSKFGCWLDTICDYLYYVMTFAGIAWGLNRRSGTNAYLLWGALLVAGLFLSFTVVSWSRRRMAAEQPDKFLEMFQSKAEKRSSNPLVFLARNTEFIIRRCFFPYALLIAALLNVIKPVFIITAVTANLVWTIALYSSFAISRNETASACIRPPMEPDASCNAPS